MPDSTNVLKWTKTDGFHAVLLHYRYIFQFNFVCGKNKKKHSNLTQFFSIYFCLNKRCIDSISLISNHRCFALLYPQAIRILLAIGNFRARGAQSFLILISNRISMKEITFQSPLNSKSLRRQRSIWIEQSEICRWFELLQIFLLPRPLSSWM